MSSFFGPDDRGEARLQRRDRSRAQSSTESVVCVTYARLSRDRAPASFATSSIALDQVHAASRLAHRALGLGMAAVADHHDLAAPVAHARHLHVHLGDERAGRVEHLEAARVGLAAHVVRHAVGGEDHRGARGHLGQLLDEHRALGAQVLDHVLVVHDLVAHVDRRAVQLERALDDVDGAVHAGAEAARLGEEQLGIPDAAGTGLSFMASPGRRSVAGAAARCPRSAGPRPR